MSLSPTSFGGLVVVGLVLESVFWYGRSRNQKNYQTNAVVAASTFVLGAALLYLGNPFWALTIFALTLGLHNKTFFGLVSHPNEIPPLIRYMRRKPDIKAGSNADQIFAYTKLKQTSRSFYPVTMALDAELREAICIFYLVCRAIDTIEDDMAPAAASKRVELINFHTHLDAGKPWNLRGYGEVDVEIELLEKFEHIIAVFTTLKPSYKAIISDIAKKMGAGMAEFLEKPVVTHKDYELYCWYVAGLVGEGLSQLFVATGREDKSVENYELYKSMGLFLQKVNITRDFHEDINVKPTPRMFYPKEIWAKHGNALVDFLEPKNIDAAVRCVNEMVTDAMSHTPDVLKYLALLKDPRIFNFCAIPQVMAIATLLEVYNNPCVFRGEVKIRRSLALTIAFNSNNMDDVYRHFKGFAEEFQKEVPASDPQAQRLHKILKDIIVACQERKTK